MRLRGGVLGQLNFSLLIFQRVRKETNPLPSLDVWQTDILIFESPRPRSDSSSWSRVRPRLV